MVEISASLLAADYARLGQAVLMADGAGVDSFHFDIMDGRYVPNLALSPQHLSALRGYSSLPFHAHLELGNPDDILKLFHAGEADCIIVCLDTLLKPRDTFGRIRALGAKVGLSLRPEESVKSAERYLAEVDVLLLLAVFPGFGGQALQLSTLGRVAQARACCDRLARQPLLAVDGGVTVGNAPRLIDAGAQMLIIGTALFRAFNMARFVAEVREAVPA